MFTTRVRGFVRLVAGTVTTLLGTMLLVSAGARPASASVQWSWTPSPFGCDASDNSCVSGTGFNPEVSTWGQDTNPIGNCTNYAAFRLANNGASQLSGSGDAATWKARVQSQFGASAANGTPSVGSIAWWWTGSPSDPGHIGYVEQVSGDTIYTTESIWNTGSRRRVLTRGQSAWPDGFLHILDQPTTPGGGTAPGVVDGSLLQVEHLSGGSTWNWYPIRPDARLVGAPSIIWPSGTPMAFGVGTDGALRQFTLNAGGWIPYLITRTGLLSPSGGVSAVQVGSNIEVFAVDASSHLIQVEYTPSMGWNWYPIRPDVTISGAPSVLWGSGGPTVFAAGTDGALRQFTLSGGTWMPYLITQTGLLSTAGGASAVLVGGTFEVFAVDKNKNLLQVEYMNGAWNWYPIRADVTLDGSPSVIWSASGPTVFGVGTDGALRQFVLESNGWTPYSVTQTGLLSSDGGASAVQVGGNYEVFTLQVA
ncbi:CHAP domain-containing protein [Jatrophihabitans sp.]|uniref:CHAP domain-containing protein n=1 Tax=Jatrophihabitans sp. TaxID=1932789 RepID=UPI002B5CAB2F|nr:CHAP domain-containing protein [Jatrophihabitans sp.]